MRSRRAGDDLVDVGAAPDGHVGGQDGVGAGAGGLHEGEALAGVGADAQRHLVGAGEAAGGEQLGQERMGDEAVVDLHDAVAAMGPETGAPVDHGQAQGGAEAPGVEGRPGAHVGCLEMADAGQRLGHDDPLELGLGAGPDVLPGAPAAAGGHRRAGRQGRGRATPRRWRSRWPGRSPASPR